MRWTKVRKVFNCVNKQVPGPSQYRAHICNGLLEKLQSKGVSDKCLSWLKSYLVGRSISVVLSGQSSDPALVNASVPQGSILGPLLFSVFIDDLGNVCQNELYLYADDSTLYAPVRSPDERDKVTASLNRDLGEIKAWVDKWKVTFESTKCKATVLSRKRHPFSPNPFFSGYNLPLQNQLDILGVTFDSRLVWSRHLSKISETAVQRLAALHKISSILDSKGVATVYKAQVRSVMEYSSLCWLNASPTNLTLLDNIQKKALKIIRTDEASACAQLAITSLFHRRQATATTLVYKMHTCHCPANLRAMLPLSYVTWRTTHTSFSMPNHALSLPVASTTSLDRSFLHTVVRIWNNLPDNVVCDIQDSGIQAFKCRLHKHLLTS